MSTSESAEIIKYRNEIRGAEVFGRGQYFQLGTYACEVSNIFYKKSSDGSNREMIVCEFLILESSNPDIEVGETRTEVFSFVHKGWMGRFKGLLLAIMGVEPSQATKEQNEQIVDLYVAIRDPNFRVSKGLPVNFLKGRRVLGEGVPLRSDPSKSGMTWHPAPPGTGA